jgi:peroxiredoxin
MIKPRQAVPALEVPTLDGSTWTLSEQNPEHFTMVVVYRGLHCPVCKRYLTDLSQNLDEFSSKGITAIALSTDPKDRAERTKNEWKLDNVTIGYDLGINKSREWGLYISTGKGKTSIGVEEPDLFAEPGLFLIRPDQTLYWANISTMPFARPNFKEILGALDFVIENDYPARGEA